MAREARAQWEGGLHGGGITGVRRKMLCCIPNKAQKHHDARAPVVMLEQRRLGPPGVVAQTPECAVAGLQTCCAAIWRFPCSTIIVL